MSYRIYMEEAMEKKMHNAPKDEQDLELTLKEGKNSLEKAILNSQREIKSQEEHVNKILHNPRDWNPNNYYAATTALTEYKKRLDFYNQQMAELFPAE